MQIYEISRLHRACARRYIMYVGFIVSRHVSFLLLFSQDINIHLSYQKKRKLMQTTIGYIQIHDRDRRRGLNESKVEWIEVSKYSITFEFLSYKIDR